MNGFLLDPSLFKQLAPERAGRKPSLRDWISAAEEPIFLSVVSVVEIGAKIQKFGEKPRATALRDWLQGLLAHDERILPVDVEVARLAGALLHRIADGSTTRLSDALLAATAKVHELELVTTRSFRLMKPDITIRDPFE